MDEEQKEEVAEEKKEEKKEEEAPQDIILKVDMHCEACARKVLKSLRRFEGVEVTTDSKSRTVVIKGKGADPEMICERIQKKTGKKVELISPLPKSPEEEEKKEEAEAPPPEEPKEEPKSITVVLKVGMHCEKCAHVLQRRIKKMNGVESVVTNIANSQVIVTGFVDAEKLVETVHRKTRKQASIVPEQKEEEPETKEEEKGEEEKKPEANEEEDLKNEINKYEYWPSRNYVEYAYTPQAFSDENPNACSVM
ncbi:heavy metal-associated isoprenylated plant protein 3-like [Canna indica]|uniref:Heavy metal-associated isoprenylated plant protein 3-like n=1 Tax=Canna indica TaxID=4628 RepID=A0AAQ3PY11_9LILI|nr:heavy metal-associated isoprenylated plant protein 3-like [Canna indica]